MIQKSIKNILPVVTVVCLYFIGIAGAAEIYSPDGFEAGTNLFGVWPNQDIDGYFTWTDLDDPNNGPDFVWDGSYKGSSSLESKSGSVFAFRYYGGYVAESKAGSAFAFRYGGYAAGASQCGSWKDFNTDSMVGNGTVWFEMYILRHGNTGSEVQCGLLEPDPAADPSIEATATSTIQAAVNLTNDGHLGFVTSGTGSGIADDFSVQLDQWYHIVLEVNYTTAKAKVYAKAVMPGDTHSLGDDYLITISGQSEFDIYTTSGSYGFAGRCFIWNNGGDGRFDDLAAYDNDIIVHPATCDEVKLYGRLLGQDISKDCYVDLTDFAILADNWMQSNDPEN